MLRERRAEQSSRSPRLAADDGRRSADVIANVGGVATRWPSISLKFMKTAAISPVTPPSTSRIFLGVINCSCPRLRFIILWR